jgi:hypothetical protein
MDRKIKNLNMVGKKVRSYDFDHDRECYVEGVVVGFEEVEGCTRYEIRVTRRIWGGEKVDRPNLHHVYPPLNGTPKIFGGECNGVELVEENG